MGAVQAALGARFRGHDEIGAGAKCQTRTWQTSRAQDWKSPCTLKKE